MTPEQFTAVIGALTLLIGAVSGLIVTVHQYHGAVNSKMDKLLSINASAAHAAGVIEGQGRPATAELRISDLLTVETAEK